MSRLSVFHNMVIAAPLQYAIRVWKELLSTSAKLELVLITIIDINFLYFFILNSCPGARAPPVSLASVNRLIWLPPSILVLALDRIRLTTSLKSVSWLGSHECRIQRWAIKVDVVVYFATYGPQLCWQLQQYTIWRPEPSSIVSRIISRLSYR